MIRFANPSTTHIVRQMWKTCFGDTDEYIDLLFTKKYKEENTLIYFEGDVAAASLQMLPYKIKFHGELVPFYYLAGLCTLPEHRRKGYMEQLIFKSFEVMKERNIPLAILVPAKEWLFGFYEKYNFQQISEEGKQPTNCLKKILDSTSNLNEAYQIFDKTFNSRDFLIWKDFNDFETIVEDSRMEGFPPKYNLASMGYILNPKYMLDLYAKNNKSAEFTIKTSDDSAYRVQRGSAEATNDTRFDFEVDVRLLCRLLFGYRTSELGEPFKNLFPSHDVEVNFMLE